MVFILVTRVLPPCARSSASQSLLSQILLNIVASFFFSLQLEAITFSADLYSQVLILVFLLKLMHIFPYAAQE